MEVVFFFFLPFVDLCFLALSSRLSHCLLPLEILLERREKKRRREQRGGERESTRERARRGGKGEVASTSLHRRILSDCLDRLVEFKMQQGPVMWQ